jgi:hypothetical protein
MQHYSRQLRLQPWLLHCCAMLNMLMLWQHVMLDVMKPCRQSE